MFWLIVRVVLQLVGLVTVCWLLFVAGEEYQKIQQERKEQDGG